MKHVPVMLDEMLHYLNPQEGGLYIDGTFGAGGYSSKILEYANCKLIAFDLDLTTKVFAEDLKHKFSNRFEFINDNFANIQNHIHTKVDGIVLDLGISSMQINSSSRGFSFMKDEELDMRMNQNNENLTAKEVVNEFSEEDLANIIFQYGDEPASRKIARSIVRSRPINTTIELAQIVRNVIGMRSRNIDSATKVFQAIRIFVNRELENIKKFLENLRDYLAIGARVVVISFHSLEDRLIKNYFKENAIIKVSKSKYADNTVISGMYELLTRKVIAPSKEEVKNNPRSRSAKLRAAKRVK